MSSFLRRIQRQVSASSKIHRDKDGNLYASPPREVFYMGRGKQLGVRNPKDASGLARMKRDLKWGRL